MLLFLLVFLGGVLTIVSPCILPVLPFVFGRAEQPFLTSGLLGAPAWLNSPPLSPAGLRGKVVAVDF